MATKPVIDAPDPRIYGFNPISHHYVKKSGAVWLRLVKAGMAEDPELIRGLQDKALARKKAVEEKKTTPAPKKAPKSKVVRAVRKHVDNNRSELDDLESDAVVEQIRKLKLTRAALADTTTDAPSSSDSESDEPEPVSRKPRKPRPSSLPGPTGVSSLSDRIRLKSQPIPITTAVDRRAALRQSLAAPLDSDEDYLPGRSQSAGRCSILMALGSI